MAKVRFLNIELSGKLGGTVYARNRGGAYCRKLVTPTNPQTSYQTSRRAALAAATAAWRNLTTVNQAAWNSYATTFSRVDSLGNAINLTGQQVFCMHYVYCAIASLTLPAAGPPTTSAPPALSSLTVTFSTPNIVGTWTGAVPTGGKIIWWQSKPYTGSRQPAHKHAEISAISAANPTSPTTIVPRQAPLSGQTIRVWAMVINASGQVSQVISADYTAA